jgi:hypothetical protein
MPRRQGVVPLIAVLSTGRALERGPGLELILSLAILAMVVVGNIRVID